MARRETTHLLIYESNHFGQGGRSRRRIFDVITSSHRRRAPTDPVRARRAVLIPRRGPPRRSLRRRLPARDPRGRRDDDDQRSVQARLSDGDYREDRREVGLRSGAGAGRDQRSLRVAHRPSRRHPLAGALAGRRRVNGLRRPGSVVGVHAAPEPVVTRRAAVVLRGSRGPNPVSAEREGPRPDSHWVRRALRRRVLSPAFRHYDDVSIQYNGTNQSAVLTVTPPAAPSP